MLQCPSCDTTLDQDFGIVTCKNCKSVLMIDLSGQVRMGSDQAYDTGEDDFENTSVESVGDEQSEVFAHEVGSDLIDPVTENTYSEDINDSKENTNVPFEDNFTGSYGADLNSDEFVGEELTGDITPSVFEDSDNEFEEFAEVDNFQEDDSVVEEVEASGNSEDILSTPSPGFEETDSEQVDDLLEDDLESFDMPSEADPNPVDVTSFANSEQSSLDEGELVYDLTISRLDSKDLKENLKYVLMDEKLKINHHEFIKKIRNGSIVIPNLNPIKAKRIVEQLQYFDVGIRWKQKRIIMEEVIEESDTAQGVSDDADL